MKKKNIRFILIGLGLILIGLVGYRLYLEYQTDIRLLLDPKASKTQLLAHIRSHGFFAALLLVVLTAVMCAVPGIPTSVIGVIAGLSFGPFIGAGINVLGNALGNISAVFLMHRLKFLDKKTERNHWVQAIQQMKHPKIGVMLGYMIPIIPSSMVNFAAETIKLPLRQLVLSIIFGVIPSSVLYACGGEALFHGYNKTAVMLIAGVAVLIGLVVFIVKDRKNSHSKRLNK
ncbi:MULTISPECIES: VTT domain-containing protein [unclassified Enterococcus]|uniref:TVP38/TMEM64 family protein n=1 Tax=unclassified Enterococcus TaxID=2608891 RepID=UPI0013E9C1C6|nr:MULTISPECIES: VTT domain-containing protein [unclassified Enterococcus]